VSSAAISRRAQRELVDAAEWIARDNPAAAEALRVAVVRAAELIGAHPEIGSVRLHLASAVYRFLPLTGYPYIVIYQIRRRGPVIVRVVHGARDLPRALRDLR
jgi:toxin ParE1/3/4